MSILDVSQGSFRSKPCFFQKQAITYRRDEGGIKKKNRKNLIEIQKQLTMIKDTQLFSIYSSYNML